MSKSKLPQPSPLSTPGITNYPNHESLQAATHSTYQIEKTLDCMNLRIDDISKQKNSLTDNIHESKEREKSGKTL
jgi:peptidoglycan hydrolase CwlO-like protein